jgi:hypothetical protein
MINTSYSYQLNPKLKFGSKSQQMSQQRSNLQQKVSFGTLDCGGISRDEMKKELKLYYGTEKRICGMPESITLEDENGRTVSYRRVYVRKKGYAYKI